MKKYCILFGFIASTLASESALVFNYQNQGDDWTSLGECNGNNQSPIDLPTYSAVGCSTDITYKLEFKDTPFSTVDLRFPQDDTEPKNIELLGQFTQLRAKTIDGDNHSFNALQFHIHSPSEHTVNGQHYDVELHIVHSLNNEDADASDNKLAVFALFFDLNTNLNSSEQDNTIFGKIGLETFTTTTGTLSNINSSTIFGDFQESSPIWAYKGSLTTPPCTETVNWFISTEILSISQNQLDFLENLFQNDPNINSNVGNNRNVQNLNGRTIYQVCENQNIANFAFIEPTIPKNEEVTDSQGQLQFVFALLLIISLII